MISAAGTAVDSGGPARPERVLLLGAGGWFGQTTLDLLRRHRPTWPILPITGRPRRILLTGEAVDLLGWDEARVAHWEPTLVVNCAFLTRERVEDLGPDRFVAENTLLTGRFLQAMNLDSVRGAITVSSGAACTPDGSRPPIGENPYGHLKRREEQLAHDLVGDGAKVLVIARAWSVSGPFVGRPRAYAFSDLILQAAQGHVDVRAPHQVWRRYVSVEDLMWIAIQRLLRGWSGTIDSGGTLVEIGELARRVIALIGGSASLKIAEPDGSPADTYHSDGTSWTEACRAVGHSESSLEHQICAVARHLTHANA